jgi:hypothetical protein
MKHRPQVVAFDVIETLFSLEPMRARFQGLGLRADALELWFARLLRNAFALDASGTFKTFGEVARATLDVMLSEHRLAALLTNLKGQPEEGGTLFDHTMVLYGSNLGDANMHVTTNLPVLLAGGGFKHGQHLAFDRARNYPLPNLFVTMLQRMGIEADKFASSTGTMKGLEFA